jgi:hypothetical protein
MALRNDHRVGTRPGKNWIGTSPPKGLYFLKLTTLFGDDAHDPEKRQTKSLTILYVRNRPSPWGRTTRKQAELSREG